MDIAYQFAQYIDNSGFGTLGNDLFVGQINPDTIGVYVIRLGGTLDNYSPIEHTILDIYAVNSSSRDAVTLLEAIKRHIHRMHTVDTPEGFIFTILGIGDIEDVLRDEEYRKIYKFTIEVTHRNNGLIS